MPSNGGYALVSGPNQQSNGFGTPRPVSYDSYMGDNPPVAPPDDNLLCLEFQNNTDNGEFTGLNIMLFYMILYTRYFKKCLRNKKADFNRT